MPTIRIHQQLHAAFIRSGLSFRELLRKSGLKIDKSSLVRKLSGTIPMKTGEAEVLAATLRVRLVWPPLGRKAA